MTTVLILRAKSDTERKTALESSFFKMVVGMKVFGRMIKFMERGFYIILADFQHMTVNGSTDNFRVKVF
jgi:hypothetical protein